MDSMITGENFIGHNRSAKGKKHYKTYNPDLNIENSWTFYEADMDEINKALELAVEAFDSYRILTGEQKAAFLTSIGEEILNLGDELIEVYCQETGLPKGRAQGERGRTIGQLNSFASYITEGSWVEAVIDTADAKREPVPKPDLRKMLVPLGPVAVFGASNFPLAFSTAGGDTASALAAGCPVIVKSHPMHSGTSELVASAIIKAAKATGMPNGVFSLLNSSDKVVGEALVLHPEIKAVGFTGSLKGGRALHDLGSLRPEPIPVFAEMGSVNPTVILPEALKDRTAQLAKTYAGSITLGAGQFCTNPGIIIGIEGDDLSEFIELLSEEIIDIEPSCMLHPNIEKTYDNSSSDYFSNKHIQINAVTSKSLEPNYGKHALVSISGNEFIENLELQEEVFGPFSMIVKCKDIEEVVTVISYLKGQLTGTIFSENNELANYPKVIDALKAKVGRIIFNGVPTGVEVCTAMLHGGPYPASTDSRFTAVGNSAIKRWVRPVSYQNWPDDLLPDELKNKNPMGIMRLINGRYSEQGL